MERGYESLSLGDIEENRCWVLHHDNETVSPADGITDLDSDLPYVSYAEYLFSNGARFVGYMCVYDC